VIAHVFNFEPARVEGFDFFMVIDFFNQARLTGCFEVEVLPYKVQRFHTSNLFGSKCALSLCGQEQETTKNFCSKEH
jgi:hypothetical protein